MDRKKRVRRIILIIVILIIPVLLLQWHATSKAGGDLQQFGKDLMSNVGDRVLYWLGATLAAVAAVPAALFIQKKLYEFLQREKKAAAIRSDTDVFGICIDVGLLMVAIWRYADLIIALLKLG